MPYTDTLIWLKIQWYPGCGNSTRSIHFRTTQHLSEYSTYATKQNLLAKSLY